MGADDRPDSFLEGAAVFGAMAFIPTYLNARFGLTLTAAGAILGFYGIGGLHTRLS